MVLSSEHLTEQNTVNPFKVGESLPKALGPREMREAFGISAATFRRQQAAGEFKPFLLPRPIGLKRYSGEKVQAFLNGRK